MSLVLSICHGAGLLDRAFMDTGHAVFPGCEIDPEMREMYATLCGGAALSHDLRELPELIGGTEWSGIIGGPPCQALSRTRAMREPKFPDLTPHVVALLERVKCKWFIFENVAPLDIPGASHVMLNAMHFGKPHQSRERWFTYKGVTPPEPIFSGDVDELIAYPAVAARIYGPKRGAVLQGYPKFSAMKFPCAQLQKGLANAVPYQLGLPWAFNAMIASKA